MGTAAAGTFLVVIGASIGATGAFLWGQWLGRDAVARLTGDRFERIDRWLRDRGLLAVSRSGWCRWFPSAC